MFCESLNYLHSSSQVLDTVTWTATLTMDITDIGNKASVFLVVLGEPVNENIFVYVLLPTHT